MLFQLVVLSMSLAALAASFPTNARVLPQLLYGKRISGQVVDSETGKAVAGAHVAFLWESTIIPTVFTAHNSRDICYHASAAITDTDGRFDIAPWSKWSTYDVYVVEPTGVVYAPNYVPYFIVLPQKPGDPPNEHRNERYSMKRFNGTASDRMRVLFWGLANRGCTYGGESQKSLYLMLRSVHDEARRTQQSRDDRETTDVIARFAAKAALAQDPDGVANNEDIDRFIRENLQ